MFSANLVILAQVCDELSRGQAKFPRILSQNGQNDLEGHGQWPPFSIRTRVSQDACLVHIGNSSPRLWRVIEWTSRISLNSESKWRKWPWRSWSMTSIFNLNKSIPGWMFVANLMIPAQIYDKLLCGQGKVYRRLGENTNVLWWEYMKILLLTQNQPIECSVPTGSTAGSGWLISSQYQRPIDLRFLSGNNSPTQEAVEQPIVTWMLTREFITNRHPVALQLTNKPCTNGHLGEKHKYIVMRIYEDSSAYSELDGQTQAMTIPLWPERPRG